MELIHAEDGQDAAPPSPITSTRHRPPRFVSEIEAEIGQLYLRTMDEPIPARLLTILRTHQDPAE